MKSTEGETMKKTIENLTKAFIGESQARNRYSFYASAAKGEGYLQISKIFLETADNEKEHAKRLFKYIQQLKKEENPATHSIEVNVDAPLILGTTAENLKSAIEGEHHETTVMYPEYADVAEKEGYKDIAKTLRAIAVAEAHHEARYRALLKEVENKSVFKKDVKTTWVCSNCGYIHEGTAPPDKCPACNHAQMYFEVKSEVY